MKKSMIHIGHEIRGINKRYIEIKVEKINTIFNSKILKEK